MSGKYLEVIGTVLVMWKQLEVESGGRLYTPHRGLPPHSITLINHEGVSHGKPQTNLAFHEVDAPRNGYDTPVDRILWVGSPFKLSRGDRCRGTLFSRHLRGGGSYWQYLAPPDNQSSSWS